MQIQPNFTAKYKYAKNEEERRQIVLKDSYKSSVALVFASGTYGILEAIDKNSITKNQSKMNAEGFKQLAKKGFKKNILIGLAVGLAGFIISEPFLNIFKSDDNDANKNEKNYKTMKELYKGAEGIGSGLTTFGMLESIQKFSIAKNKPVQTADEIGRLAKKGLKRNVLLGLLGTALGYIIAWPSFKLCEPMQMKLQEWADNQNRIAEKAEQLVKEENQNSPFKK